MTSTFAERTAQISARGPTQVEPIERGKRIATYGGMPVTFGVRPLAHIHTTDGNVWLWDPRAAGISDRAVAYPASALTVRVVASGKSSCR